MKLHLLAAVLFAAASPLMAQVSFAAPTRGLKAPTRGLNLARGTAIASNGGLGLFHPARCMFVGTASSPCLTKREWGFEYRFLGGRPGWEPLGLPPAVEAIVLISPDGRSVVAESYFQP